MHIWLFGSSKKKKERKKGKFSLTKHSMWGRRVTHCTDTLGYLFVFEQQDISTSLLAGREILQMFVKISTLGAKSCHRLAMMCWRLRVGLLGALRWLFSPRGSVR